MEANKIIGKAEGQAIKIYTSAFSKDQKFYEFYKTMDVYKKTMSAQNIIISTKDNEFLNRLKKE